jgi:hypothetical protein
MNQTFTRPSVQVGVDWISKALTWPKDDVAEFNAVRKQFRQLKCLQDKLRADLNELRQNEKAAHAKLASSPSPETVALAEQARRAVSLASEELPRSLKHLDNSLDELVRNRLVPVAVKLNTGIFDYLIAESKAIEAQEQALAKKYNADEYVPSELVKALVYRASRFFTTAQSIQKVAEAGGARNLTPDSCLDGVIPPEK